MSYYFPARAQVHEFHSELLLNLGSVTMKCKEHRPCEDALAMLRPSGEKTKTPMILKGLKGAPRPGPSHERGQRVKPYLNTAESIAPRAGVAGRVEDHDGELITDVIG